MIKNIRRILILLIALIISSTMLFAIENVAKFAQQISAKYPSYSVARINSFLEKGSNKYLNESQLEKLFFKKTVFDQTLKQLQKIDQPSLKARLYFYLATLSTEVLIGEEQTIAQYFKRTLDLNPSFENKDIALYNYAYYNLEAVKNSVFEIM